MLADAQQQGFVPRNAAEHVDLSRSAHQVTSTPTPRTKSARCSLQVANDRLGHAWELALSGCGAARSPGCGGDVDLDGETLSIVNNRVEPAASGGERSEVGDFAAHPAAAGSAGVRC